LGEDHDETGSVGEALEHLDGRIGLAARSRPEDAIRDVIPLTNGEYRA
jgi:hypothetical protein